MSKSGKQIFEEYAVGTPHDRFVLIYNNYGVFENVIGSYEHSVFKQIRDEKEYNRKHRSAGIEELGIRVQSGGMPSDITAKLLYRNKTNLNSRRMLHQCLLALKISSQEPSAISILQSIELLSRMG